VDHAEPSFGDNTKRFSLVVKGLSEDDRQGGRERLPASADGLDRARHLIIFNTETKTPALTKWGIKMIEYFRVNNYKCLVDTGLPLTPIHVIIGQNDSGKTSLLEAMLGLSRSTSKPLADAFSGDWQDRELVFAGEEKPVIQFDVRLGVAEGQVHSPVTYHLEVEFGTGRSCRRTDEWYENSERIPIREAHHGFTGVASRKLNPGTVRNSLDSMAEQLETASLYRFEPRMMAIPAAIDPRRKFRMDPDGFGLATLLDDILGYDAERFLALRRDFCEFFPQFRSVRIESIPALQREFSESGRHSANQATGKGIFFVTTNGRQIRAEQSSDGAILFLGLLALIHSPEPPKLLLIEEPEKGVYPKRLEEVIRLIRRLHEAPSGRAAPQIIMTTHSPYLLSSFHPDEVTLMVRRDGSGPVQARPLRDAPNIEERLGQGEFYLGELWYNLSEEELFADA
jgi:predicted ATPase